MFTSFKRILKFGAQGFWRNKGLSAQVIFIMMVAVFAVTFSFFFRQLSYFLIEEAQKKVDILYRPTYHHDEQLMLYESEYNCLPLLSNHQWLPLWYPANSKRRLF